MYLIDTNVVSELRKGARADPCVLAFFQQAAASGAAIHLSAVSIGELRRGVEMIRRRGGAKQSELLETWLATVVERFGSRILPLDAAAAQIWGRLRSPDPEHALDKQIAAIALLRGLTVVTRNTADFDATGARLLNPFMPLPAGG